jgi:hypothetical protein
VATTAGSAIWAISAVTSAWATPASASATRSGQITLL